MPDEHYWSTTTLQTPISDDPYEREREFYELAVKVVSDWKNWPADMARDKLRGMTRTEIRRWLFRDWSSDLNDFFSKDEVTMVRKLAGIPSEDHGVVADEVMRAVNRHNGREAMVFHWKHGHTAAIGQLPLAIADMYADFPRAQAAAKEGHWAVMYQNGMGPAWSILTESEFLVTFDVVS